MPYANNKGADQPAHSRSLISAFVVRCLDSTIKIVTYAQAFIRIITFLWKKGGHLPEATYVIL